MSSQDKNMASQSQPVSGAVVGSEPSASFTPGPWRIEGRRGAGFIISHGINAEADGPAGYVGVLDPMFHVAGEGNHAADVALMVAAPAMYRALQRIADAPAWGAPERWETTPAEVRLIARKALAQAVQS